jgi:flagellar motor switch protein FliM
MASAMMETANDLANDTQPLDNQAGGTIRALTSRTPDAGRPYQVLNPCTIGRPVHLIDKFTARLRADLAERFCLPLNRRYCAGFEIADVSLVHSSAQPEAAQRWRHYRTATARVDVAVDRDLLLGILHFRYGTPGTPTGSPAVSVPVSAGEERLAAALSEQLIAIVTGRIEGPAPAATPESVGKESHSGFTEVCGDAPIEDAWSLRVEIGERTRRFHGPVLFALDGACVTRLLHGLGRARQRPAAKDAPALQPLAARLQLRLVARLLEEQIPLGILLEASIGDVIPIRLGPTDVLIGDSRLFTACIAEHRGKLCLTSFEDVE